MSIVWRLAQDGGRVKPLFRMYQERRLLYWTRKNPRIKLRYVMTYLEKWIFSFSLKRVASPFLLSRIRKTNYVRQAINSDTTHGVRASFADNVNVDGP